jgi:hypothetical protein
MTDKTTENTFVEGEDFYFNEAGLMVLTEKYHLKRGYCCHSNCKHCPYDYAQDIDPNIPLEFQLGNKSEDEIRMSSFYEQGFDPEEEEDA